MALQSPQVRLGRWPWHKDLAGERPLGEGLLRGEHSPPGTAGRRRRRPLRPENDVRGSRLGGGGAVRQRRASEPFGSRRLRTPGKGTGASLAWHTGRGGARGPPHATAQAPATTAKLRRLKGRPRRLCVQPTPEVVTDWLLGVRGVPPALSQGFLVHKPVTMRLDPRSYS